MKTRIYEILNDQEPPHKWLVYRLRELARTLVSDPTTLWIGERDPAKHICWTAADRLDSILIEIMTEPDLTPSDDDREKRNG